MNARQMPAVLLNVALSFVLLSQAMAEPPKTEIQGAAILDHPCGKVAVKHMGLVHAGKIEEANKLGTQEMQEQWKALPAKDREMMTEMMKEMSKPEEQFAAEIKAGGLLVIEGNKATLTVKQEHKDANGSVTDTLTQSYVLDGAVCRITRQAAALKAMEQPVSPELETLDQLLGGDLPLTVIRDLFDTDDRFVNAIAAMLHAGEVQLHSADGNELPQWRWQQVLSAVAGQPTGARLAITDAGARRIG